MKKLTLTLCVMAALAGGVYAGTEMHSGKEMQTVQTPCPTWYADNEFNISVSGIYAPTANGWQSDRYLGVDHGWGAALDAKYFFHRYYGVGIQGFGVSNSGNNDRFDNDFFVTRNGDNSGWAGGVLGTFTLRYPIPCSRFAPYGWAGVGGIWGGGVRTIDFNDDTEFFQIHNNDGGRLMGQYGLGFEVRFTPHFGMLNDVSYNQIEGGQNDFWQIRTGLNFAF